MDTRATVTVNNLKSCLEAFNRHDLDEVMTFFGDHPVLEMPRGPHPWGTRAEGRVAVRALLATRFEGFQTSTIQRTGISSAAIVAFRNGS